jgi:hypothetical protein
MLPIGGERERRKNITPVHPSRPELAAIARFQDGTFVLAYILLILTYRPMSGRALRNTTAPNSRVTIPTALVMATIVVFT